MSPEDSIRTVGYLVAMTTGWNDETVEIYHAELQSLRDPDVALAAVRSICSTELETFRPSIGKILAEYERIQRRRAEDEAARRPKLAARQLVPPAEGYRIAWNAYLGECEAQGRKPNRQLFESWARLATQGSPDSVQNEPTIDTNA
jgi:hypothetical protein